MTHRILVVIGTRPEAIKLFPLVRLLRERDDVQTFVCATAQHREMLDQVLTLTDIVPDFDLNLMKAGQSLDQLSSSVLLQVGQVLDTVRPSRLVVQGDTSTAMMSALAAFYRRIPVCHVEAGLRSFDIYSPWPEEANRKIIGQIAEQHFAPTTRAAEALLKEGVPSQQIHVTGNTVIDALKIIREKMASTPKWQRAREAAKHDNHRSILVTCHRRENFGKPVQNVASALLDIAGRGDTRILVQVHPNPNVSTVFRTELASHPLISLLPPLDYDDFVAVLDGSYCVLTDSGGVQEEAPALGKPVLVLRDTTERPEAVEAGTARLVGTNRGTIVAETNRLLDDPAFYQSMAFAHNPFGDGFASNRIVGVMLDA